VAVYHGPCARCGRVADLVGIGALGLEAPRRLCATCVLAYASTLVADALVLMRAATALASHGDRHALVAPMGGEGA